jgi:hypothetical protein
MILLVKGRAVVLYGLKLTWQIPRATFWRGVPQKGQAAQNVWQPWGNGILETKILLLQQNTCENKKQRHNIQVYNLPTTKPRHQAEASYMVQFVDTRDMFVHTPSISKCDSREHDHTISFCHFHLISFVSRPQQPLIITSDIPLLAKHYWTSVPKVLGSIPTVVKKTFQLARCVDPCTLRITSQTSFTWVRNTNTHKKI